MKYFFYFMIVFFTVWITSCKKKDKYISLSNYESIFVNPEEAKIIDISDTSKYNISEIVLEFTDRSMLTYIEQLEFMKNKLFIYDKHRVIVFNSEGSFLYNIGEKGGGPGEYTNINSFFLNGDSVYIYDNNIQKLFIYEQNGNFIGSKRTDENIASVCPVNDQQFIGRKKYQGDRVKVPILTLLDRDLNLIYNVENKFLTSGISVFDFCYSYNNEILYWEFLNDTIYSIKDTYVNPHYYIDFQKFKIPTIERQNKDISQIIEYLNSSNLKHAVGVRYVQQDRSNLRFIYSFNERINYVNYNKETKETLQYEFYDSKNILNFQYFMKYKEGNIILVAYDLNNEEINPKLLLINESKMAE